NSVAIHELNAEQIRTWSLEQKDRWWLENVFRGDMPQLTGRSALTGMGLGAVLSLTNIYVGAKTGWTLGVGITSVILAFALFKALARLGLADEFTILENNAMQSIATASGYMTSPLISSLAAYMMVTNQVIPMWQLMSWVIALAVLGVLFAFPFKRRFINDEQLPFPEGRAAGIVMDSLHHGDAATGLLKAKLLVLFAALAAAVKLLQSETITAYLTVKDFTLRIPEFLDEWIYKHTGTPEIMGTHVTSLTLRPELDLPMVGAGGLMGIRTGASLMLGAVINYAVLAPIMIARHDIVPSSKGTIGFREITFWSLWCGVAMMTAASLLAFFGRPKIIWAALSKLASAYTRPGAEGANADVLGHIELPLTVSLVGVPAIGALVALMAHGFFGIAYWLSVTAIGLVFFFCLIAINSTGLTSITPIGAMGKLTQLTFGVLAPGDKQVNLMTAGITGEVASHAANLLQDIKPGYMLGAKPRQQAVGHVLGIFAGAALSIPVFYVVFLKLPPSDLLARELSVPYSMDSRFAMPAATVWKAVADVLAEGIHTIKLSAQIAALAGIAIGIFLEVMRLATKGRFPLSPVALGLGFLIPFHTCLSIFAGSFMFWAAEKLFASEESRVNHLIVKNQEPICAGLIAGGALTGIAVAVAELFL
ncbi:MAG TPA: OPT family oligopeptide transporter, partial [Pirellulales bacterium]|nr:OPT family oligopeptide transporter [Pirellulales bacterium]